MNGRRDIVKEIKDATTSLILVTQEMDSALENYIYLAKDTQ